MTALFGPQTSGAVITKPSSAQIQRYGGVQTWFKDCSGPGASDGTVPDAAFFNRIVGALDYICGASGVSAIAGDDSVLYRAVLQIVSQDAPDALNSLRELADAIADDPNFAGTIMSMLANRLRFDQAQFLNSTQKAQAVSNLGLANVAVSGDYNALINLPTLGTAASKDVGTGANQVVQLTAAGKYPAVDGSLITSFATVARSGAYGDLSGKPTLGTAAALNVGTGANQVVQLDGAGKLPAVDASQLINVTPGTGALRYDTAQGTLTTAQKIQAQNNAGIATTTAPAAGMSGELIISSTSINFAASGSSQNVTSIVLTPGVWDIEAIGGFSGSGSTTSSDWLLSVGTTSASVISGQLYTAHNRSPAGLDYSWTLAITRRRVTVAANTTYYLNAQASFSGSTYSVSGEIAARRV